MYKAVGHPFLNIDVEDFIEDLRELLHEVDAKYKAKGIERYPFDEMPVATFMNHYN